MEVTKEAKANLLTLVASAWAKGFGGVSDREFVENGTTSDQENLIEGPLIYTDIGVLKDIVLLPLIPDNAEDSVDKQAINQVGKKVQDGGHMVAIGEPLAGIEVAAAPNSNGHK